MSKSEVVLNLVQVATYKPFIATYEFAYKRTTLVFNCQTASDETELFLYLYRLAAGHRDLKFAFMVPQGQSFRSDGNFVRGPWRQAKTFFEVVKAQFEAAELLKNVPMHWPFMLEGKKSTSDDPKARKLIFFLASQESCPTWAQAHLTLIQRATPNVGEQ